MGEPSSQDDSPSSEQDQDALAACRHQLGERLQDLLRELDPALQTDVKRALAGPGKLLSQNTLSAGYWSLLTLLVAQTISPSVDSLMAQTVAIAVECFICALDLLDDVEDEDQTESIQALGMARALNISTALIMLSQRAILSCHCLDKAKIAQLLTILQKAALIATAGQHHDFLAEEKLAEDCTYEECIEMAQQKAGALVGMACHLGSSCAEADEETCQKFVELGNLLGIASQLDNDGHDLYYLLYTQEQKVKSDLTRGKKTLPIVLAAKAENEVSAHQKPSGDPIVGSSAGACPERGEPVGQVALREGILATWGISLLYRERARHCLQEIEKQYPISLELRALLRFK